MKNQKLKQFTFLLTLFTLTNLASCGKDGVPQTDAEPQISNGEIVNGKKVTSKNELEHFTVALEIANAEGKAICTGSIVSANYILTAAHCVDNEPKNVKVIFDTDVKKSTSDNTRVADKYVQHSAWGKHSAYGEGDLALIHFKGKIPDGHGITKITSKDFAPENNQETFLLGFGVTNGIKRTGAGVLRQAKTEIIDQRTETEFILDGRTSSVCFGDSGGPAFIKSKNEYFQWAVASSVSNQECNETSVHTAIAPYLDWINKNIHSKSKKVPGTF